MKKIKKSLYYIAFFVLFILAPIIIHFTYFLTLSETDYPTKHTSYIEQQNYHIFDLDTMLLNKSYDKDKKITNSTIYKWYFYTNEKYKSYLLYNINEIKNFIIMYLLIIVISTYAVHKKSISSKYVNYMKHYSIISIFSIFVLAFLFSDSKLYHTIENSYKFEEALSSKNSIKVINNKMTLLNDVSNMPQNNFSQLKSKIEAFDNNLTYTMFINSHMSNVSYFMLSKYIIFSFSSDLIQVSKKIDNNQRDNAYYEALSHYYDILIIINVIIISYLIFNNKNLNNLKNILIFINLSTILYIFGSMMNISIMNVNINKLLLESLDLMDEKNYVQKKRELLDNISIIYSIKSTLLKNQILLLLFSFIIIQKEIIEKIKILIKNEKFLIIIITITVFFLIQTLLVSFNLFILFSIIVYLSFFIRDNIKINNINTFIIIFFFLFSLQELFFFIFEQHYLNNINNLIEKFISNPERTNNFTYIEYVTNEEKLSKNKFFTEYYSKSFSIILATFSYFFIQYSNLLNVDKKSKKKQKK